jgi:hypothetical protein
MYRFEIVDWLRSLSTGHLQALNKAGINYGKGKDDDKVALYTRSLPELGNQKQLECNGLILREESWDILCVPPFRALHQQKQIKKLSDDELKEFEIIEAINGTAINLYYDSKWTISTHRSTDVTNVIRYNATFKQFLKEVVEEFLGISCQEFFDGLDKKKSYSFIIEHPVLNKFLDHKKIWYTQSTCLNDDGVVEFDFENPPFEGILVQKKWSPIEYAEFLGIDSERPLEIKDLYEKCEFPTDYNRENMIMGIILRPIDYFSRPSYFIESKVMAYIRNTWFLREKKGENELLRVMRGVLYDKNKFMMMFPRFEHAARIFLDFLELIADQVVAYWSSKNKNVYMARRDKKNRPILIFRFFKKTDMDQYRPTLKGTTIFDRALNFVLLNLKCEIAVSDFAEFYGQSSSD